MNYIKGGLKVLVGYLISLLIFVIFLYMFLSISKDNFYKWLPVYSFVLFLLMFAILYSDIKKLAVKEKRPQYGLKPYPLKGLVLGLIGFSPVIVLELVYPLISFDSDTLNKIKELVINTIMGPLYFAVRLAGGTTLAYAAASLIVPVIAMLAYLAGYHGVQPGKMFKRKQPQPSEKTFQKSPWNPSVKEKKK